MVCGFQGLVSDHKRPCTPLTISEAHSRYLLCCQGLGGATGFITIKPLFIQTFRKYGLPESMRTDNESPSLRTNLSP